MAQHQDHWFTNIDDQLIAEYIARHKIQLPFQELEDVKNTCEYSCGDPRMHPRHQEHPEDAAKEAERRIDDDFKSLTAVLECHVEDHKVLLYCVVLQCLAPRYPGGGIVDPVYIDDEHPSRASPQFSLMFWNLGNWCRKHFEKCPLPERLQKFAPHIDHDLDIEHKKIGDTSHGSTTISSTSSRTLGHIFS